MRYKKGSFIIIPNKEAIKGKKPTTQSVYTWVCDHADEDGVCFPSTSLIAKEAGVSRRQVFRELENLENFGLLQRTERNNEKGKTSNSYQIMLPDEADHVTNSHMGSDSQAQPHVTDSHISNSTQTELTPSNSIPATTVAEVIDVFKKSVNPKISFGHKTYRKATQELVEQFGTDIVIRAAQYAVSVIGQPYAPVIGNPYQLKMKWPELVAFKKRSEGSSKQVSSIQL